MLRNVLFASAVLSMTNCLTGFAGQATEEEATKNAGKNTDQQVGKAAENQGSPQKGQWKNPDHCFASCVALGNQEEVALGQIGAKTSSNEDVKKFAEMLVKDHTMYLTKLQKFAPEASKAGYLGTDKEEASVDERKAVRQVAATDDADTDTKVQTAEGKSPKHAARDMQQVERELAVQCLTSSKEALEEKSGAEFDKCFIGMQIAKHMGMRDKLIVYQRHASSELAPLFAAGQKKTEEHLAKAKEIMKSLEQGSPSDK